MIDKLDIKNHTFPDGDYVILGYETKEGNLIVPTEMLKCRIENKNK